MVGRAATPALKGVALIDEARRRLDAGDPRSARTLAQAILGAAREAATTDQLGPAAQLVGECLYVMGEVDAAWPLAEEALRADQAAGNDVAVASDLNLIGVLQLTAGRTQEATETLRRSYELRVAAMGPDHEDAIESLNNLAVALWSGGEQGEAITLHEEALGRCERVLGEGHRTTATTLNALAVKTATLDGGAQRARALYERALAAAELALGPDAELVARLLTNVASARLNDGDLSGTSALLDRALELHERHFGPMSRWTAHVLHVQGSLAGEEERHAQARLAFERAFVIRVKELGPTDGATVASAFGLASALGALTQGGDEAMAEATALHLPLMALRPQVASSFFRGRSMDPEMAGEQLRRIAQRLEERVAPDPHRVAARERARTLMDDADAAFLNADFGRAADRLRESIAVLESAFGDASTALVEPLYRLRHLLRAAGTEAEVLPILDRIATILSVAYGDAHPLTLRALAEQYWQERREYGPGGGRETARRIEGLAGRTLGEGHPITRVLRDVFEAARAATPGDASPDSEPLSARRERYLATPNALQQELLADLGSIPWPRLAHAHGPALDTSHLLRILLSSDDRLRNDALALLAESLLHGGTPYPATAPAMRLVRRLASDPRVPGRAALLELLVAGKAAARDEEGGSDLDDAIGDLPGLLARLAAADPEAEVVDAALALLGRMGSASEES